MERDVTITSVVRDTERPSYFRVTRSNGSIVLVGDHSSLAAFYHGQPERAHAQDKHPTMPLRARVRTSLSSFASMFRSK